MPLAELPYDLLLPDVDAAQRHPGVAALLDLVTGAAFAAEVAALPGCSTTRTGQQVRRS